jgi:hypothetical protein
MTSRRRRRGRNSNWERVLALNVLALAFVFLASDSSAQAWNINGTQVCYSYQLPNTPSGLPQQVQCFSRGTILSLTSPTTVDESFQQYQSYQAGKQLGQGVGSLMVILVKAWEAHHQRVVNQEKDERKQIEEYLRANMALFDEQIAMMNQDLENMGQLQAFEPEYREKLNDLAKDRKDLIANTLKLRENVRAYECTAVTGNQPRKDLKYALNGQGGAEWLYNSRQDQLKKEWVLNRALALVVASHKGEEIMEPSQNTETYNNVCSP